MILKDCIRLENYTKETQKGDPLLVNISLGLEQGKCTALVGVSGEGKSLLMDAIAGKRQQSCKTYGNVWVQPPVQSPKGRRSEGQVGDSKVQKEQTGHKSTPNPQKPAEAASEPPSGMVARTNLREWFGRVGYMTQAGVDYENIKLGVLLSQAAEFTGRTEEEMTELLRILRLERVKNVDYQKISGGEKTRTRVLLSLLASKEINIWDEPLTGLDAGLAGIILREVKKRSATNLISIHHISPDILDHFENLIVLHNKTIIYSGPLCDAQEKLESAGVVFPKNVFWLTGLIHLLSGSTAQPNDELGIKALSQISSELWNAPRAPLALQPSSPLVVSHRVRPRAVALILQRAFSTQQRRKKISAVLTLVLSLLVMPVALVCLKTWVQSKLDHIPTGTSPEEVASIRRLFLLLAPENPRMLENYVTYNYTRIIFIFAFLYFLINGLFLVSYPFTTRSGYYKLCKRNISEGHFSEMEYIVAQSVELGVKEFAVPCMYFLLSLGIDVVLFDRFFCISKSDYGLSFYVFAILFLFTIRFMYLLAMLLSPLSTLARVVFSCLYDLFLNFILSGFFLKSYLEEPISNSISAIYGTYDPHQEMVKIINVACRMLPTLCEHGARWILTKLGYFLLFAIKYSPSLSASRLWLLIGARMKYINSVLPPSLGVKKDNLEQLRDPEFAKNIRVLHDYFETEKIDTTLQSICFKISLYFIMPFSLLVLSFLLICRNLRPKLG